MKNVIFISKWIFPIVVLLSTFHQSHSQTNIQCPKTGGKAPALPKAFSTNIRVNFLIEKITMEVKYATIGKDDKELIEIKTADKHVKYITRGDQKTGLYIQYNKDEHPTCKVTETTKIFDYLKKDYAEEGNLFVEAAEILMYPNIFDIYSVGTSTEFGIISRRYDGCLSNPEVKVSMIFSAGDWEQSHTSALSSNRNYPVQARVETEKTSMTALYSYFDPTVPDDAVFQPPEDVFCDGFRTDKKPPKMPDYFSYNSEIIVYEGVVGMAPLVSRRMVYYDYPAGISRMDFYDPLAEDSDMFSKVRAQEKSIIHDYNAGVQYIFDPFTGKCSIDNFQATFSVVSLEETKNNKMMNGSEYFWLNNTKTSYNGQYPVNGMMADLYTASRVDPKTGKNFIISWAFATEEARVVENENVEKNALLRMYVRPETGMNYEGVTQINFYSYSRAEPDTFTYDLTNCFNDSNSKTLVLTLPASEPLKGANKIIASLTHLAIKDVTGMRKQQIYVKEVFFSEKKIYAEFMLLEISPTKNNDTINEISLDDALKKLKEAVTAGKFIVNVPVVNNATKIISLKPEPNGLNVFSGDKKTKKPAPVEGYKEGSVISLTVGMLFLGFILGGVTLNLVIGKKFGVSLFQKSRPGNSEFNNPLNESSM